MKDYSSFTGEEIRNRFNYHPPGDEGKARHECLSLHLENVAHIVDQTCPASREKSLAMTRLEEAKFWASAAVARNPETR